MQMSGNLQKLGGGGGGVPPPRSTKIGPPPQGPPQGAPRGVPPQSQPPAAIANDCVLYKFDGINTIDYILGIIDFTKIESGLYFETPGQSGITNYSVQPNESVINAFKIESNKDNWVSSGNPEQYENTEGKTLFLCIGNPNNKIYTTTGTININSDFKIISTTTIFVEFQNKQYVPGKQSLLSTVSTTSSTTLAQAQAQATQSVFSITQTAKATTATSAKTTTKSTDLWEFLTQKMMSPETFKLLFYLNCVDISKIESLNLHSNENTSFIQKLIPKFMQLLMAEISMTSDVNLNSKFLQELLKLKIISKSDSSENMPMHDLLLQYDKFDNNLYNSCNIYSNAGLNFTKIFKLLKKQEFAAIVIPIVDKYYGQLDSFIKYIESIGADKIKFNSAIAQMQTYVSEKTKRPKNIVIINVKTRVPKEADKKGVRNPMNLRYDVTKSIDGKLLKIHAIDSSYPLYEKQDLRGDALLIDNTKGEVTKSQGKLVFNRKTKVICGPFDDILDPNNNNKSISQSKIFTEIKSKLNTDKYVCVFGKGISGSGKTSIMIYNMYGDGLDGKIGALFHLCNDLHSDPKFNCNRIRLKRSELCADPKVCDADDVEYVFEWMEAGKGKDAGFYCTSPDTFNTKHISDKTKSDCDQKTLNSCTIKEKSLHEVAELLLTKTRLVRTTPLNPSSSRSHSALTLCMECASNACFLTIVDAAGKEKVIECNYKILLRLANTFADTEENKNKPDNDSTKERSYHFSPPPGPPLQNVKAGGNTSGGGGGGALVNIKPLISRKALKNREDLNDFTQVNKLIDLLKQGSEEEKKTQIRDILHVLGGCDGSPIQDDVVSDEKLKQLLKADRIKFLEEINPNAVVGTNSQSQFVKNLEIIVQNLQKIHQIELWVAEYTDENNKVQKLPLPFEGNSQYVKASGNKSQGETPRFYFGSDKTDSSPGSNFKITAVSGTAFKSLKVVANNSSSTSGAMSDFHIIVYDKNENTWKDTGIPVSAKSRNPSKTTYEKQKTYEFKDDIELPEEFKDIMPIESANQSNYTTFYENYDKSFEKQKKEFNDWKAGKQSSIELFVTQNHKIRLGRASEYRDDLTPKITAFMSPKQFNDSKKTQFYENAKRISDKLDYFFDVTGYMKSLCDELTEQGLFINRELTDSDDVINTISVKQNGGRPNMPPYGILNNNEYYEFAHVYDILKSASIEEDAMTYVQKSKIIHSMFEMICALSGATTETNKRALYEEIERRVSFFFFTVVNLSPDTEMQDRVQYHHTIVLRKLLKQMRFNSVFDDFSIEKQNIFSRGFLPCLDEIEKYYKTQNLSNVAEITMLLANIENAKNAILQTQDYEEAIRIVDALVLETNSINGSTIIGSIADDGNTCILQQDSGYDDQQINGMTWTSMEPAKIMV
jgi:hypothetical protein